MATEMGAYQVPNWTDVRLARTISNWTRDSRMQDKLVPRSGLEMWFLFLRRKTVIVRDHDGQPVASASLIHTFHKREGLERRRLGEFGAWITRPDSKQNGYGRQSGMALLAEQRIRRLGRIRPHEIYALAEVHNLESNKGLTKIGGTLADNTKLPDSMFREKVNGQGGRRVFNAYRMPF